jgi:apoptosis-inducing factor 2
MGRILLTRDEYTADYLFVATGNKPRGGLLLSSLAPYAITESGHIAVTSKLNLAKHPNIYVIGDSNDTPVPKIVGACREQGEVAAQVSVFVFRDAVESICDKRRVQNVIAASAHVDYKPGQEAMGVTVGPNGGQIQLWGFILGVSLPVCVSLCTWTKG